MRRALESAIVNQKCLAEQIKFQHQHQHRHRDALAEVSYAQAFEPILVHMKALAKVEAILRAEGKK